uniref:Peptidase S1 domain-containing protein n=1 Tax=Panagrellus redivivus TaxID=6233 RepID=A0A7E4UWN4_PANRE
MTDLSCTVAVLIVLAYLSTVADSAYVCDDPKSPGVNGIPEICFKKVKTGGLMNDRHRQSAVDVVNLFRALIANQCDKFKSGKPKSANFRKIRYSCDLEQRVKFKCPANANDDFKTSKTVFRSIDIKYATSIFYRSAPRIRQIEIKQGVNGNQMVSGPLSETMRFYLNDAVEIGCYLENCHDKLYFACTTGTEIPTSDPLYKAGTRCRSNKDCKDTGYPICDMEFGLCQQGDLPYICRSPKSATVRLTPEACSDNVDTGSLMSKEERRFTVEAMNLFRGFIANQCDAFKSGKPKSANLRKIRYNCKLEEQAKFECPTTPDAKFETNDMFLRIIMDTMDEAKRTSIFYRRSPALQDIEMNPNRVLIGNFKGNDLLSFTLNEEATEVGCFLRLCHGKEYMACTTGKRFDWTKPLYTPGNRCQKNADCPVPGYPNCDTEYGLCNLFTCKFSDSSLTFDACNDLRRCSEATDKAEPEKHFCQSTVIIAEQNNDNTFTVKAFGAAIGENHFLTSVSSEFDKNETTDLYVIVGGGRVYPLRAAGVDPQMHYGDFDVNAWQDLVLVKLAATSPFKFNQYLKIKEVGSGLQDKSLTVRLHPEGMDMISILLQPDDECVKTFYQDPFTEYVKNSNMACGLDENNKGTKFLSGAPLADVPLTDGQHTLYGIRSEQSSDPEHDNAFLVTKLAPNCDWLVSVSEGTVKCI